MPPGGPPTPRTKTPQPICAWKTARSKICHARPLLDCLAALNNTPKYYSTLLLFGRSVISAWGHLKQHENCDVLRLARNVGSRRTAGRLQWGAAKSSSVAAAVHNSWMGAMMSKRHFRAVLRALTLFAVLVPLRNRARRPGGRTSTYKVSRGRRSQQGVGLPMTAAIPARRAFGTRPLAKPTAASPPSTPGGVDTAQLQHLHLDAVRPVLARRRGHGCPNALLILARHGVGLRLLPLGIYLRRRRRGGVDRAGGVGERWDVGKHDLLVEALCGQARGVRSVHVRFRPERQLSGCLGGQRPDREVRALVSRCMVCKIHNHLTILS